MPSSTASQEDSTRSITRSLATSIPSFIQHISQRGRDHSGHQKRWAVYQPSWWPPISHARSQGARPTSSRFSFDPSRDQETVPASTAPLSSGLTPAQQVIADYIAAKAREEEDREHALYRAVAGLHARVQRDSTAIWLHREVKSQVCGRTFGTQGLAELEGRAATGSSVPFPVADSYFGEDPHSGGHGDPSHAISDLAASGSTSLPASAGLGTAPTSGSVAPETVTQNARATDVEYPAWLFNPPGDWTPRVEARLETEAVVVNTPPGELFVCPREGCNRTTDREGSLRFHLFLHNLSTWELSRAQNGSPIQDDPEAAYSSSSGDSVIESDDHTRISSRLHVDSDELSALAQAFSEAEAVAGGSRVEGKFHCPRLDCDVIAENTRSLAFHLHMHGLDDEVSQNVSEVNETAPEVLATTEGGSVGLDATPSDQNTRTRKSRGFRKKMTDVIKSPFIRKSKRAYSV